MGGQSIRMNDLVKVFGEEKITKFIESLEKYGGLLCEREKIQLQLLTLERFEYFYLQDWYAHASDWSNNAIFNFCLAETIGKDRYHKLVEQYAGFRLEISKKWIEKRQIYLELRRGEYPLRLAEKYGVSIKTLQRRAQRYEAATNSSSFLLR